MSAGTPGSLRELIDVACERHGERTALRSGKTSRSYRELHLDLRKLAAGLRELGVGPGDRVAIHSPNSQEFFELYLACAWMGAVLVPLNRRLSSRELRDILRLAEPAQFFVAGEVADDLAELWRELGGERCLRAQASSEDWRALHAASPADWKPALDHGSLAQLYFTSGTTGKPKGVQLSHGNVASHAMAAVEEFGLGPADTWGHLAPMFHLADAWSVFAVTACGGCHAFAPNFDPATAYALFRDERVTMTNLVPTMLQRLVREEPDDPSCLESVRCVLSGGAPIAPELVDRVQSLFGAEYIQTYGLTETSPFLTISSIDEEIAALSAERQFFYRSRTGRPFGGIELRVVDEVGRVVARDGETVGEIQARGPWVFSGYWRDETESREAFDGDWFRTGDLATVEERGYLHIVDRKKDVILSGGETVYSTEVENALYTHARIESAAVFPLVDEEWGEVVAAALVLTEDSSRPVASPELFAHCELFLARFKVPRVFFFLDALPLSGSGKVQKRVLRERCQDLQGVRRP